MTLKWQSVPILPVGPMGEAQDEMVIQPPRLKILRNAFIAGPGRVRQATDWLKADILKNLAGTPVAGHAVCGAFPFIQQGGLSVPSGGIAFSFNGDDDKVYLHHLDENGIVQRTLAAYSTFTNQLPPQITGFEMFGKFYFCEYGRESAATRKGLAVYDPTGAGAVTIPTFDLVTGGAAAAALRFRGICVHRGATILGWGYQNEETGGIDVPHAVRYCKYDTPDTWIPDTTDQTAGFFNLGTLGLPVIGCAPAGQYTILGKEQEIFALDGDFSANFYPRKIGVAHGPVSTIGIVSAGTFACWMSLFGPVWSDGTQMRPIAIDKDLRRFLSYLDLTTCAAEHDAARNRIVWALRRREDDQGVTVTSPYLTELLWWDYVREEFGVQSLPKPIFCLGSIRGKGETLVGPTGVVSGITASNVGSIGATISWTPGDNSPDVTFQVEYRVNGTTPWTIAGKTPPATYSKTLTALDPTTTYDVRVAQIRNAQQSAYTTATALFTTLAAPPTPDLSNPTVSETGNTFVNKGKVMSQVVANWTPFNTAGVVVRLYRRFNATLPGPFDPPQGEAAPSAGTEGILDPSYETQFSYVYYWLRVEAIDGSAFGEYTPCQPLPLFVSGFA